MVILVRLQASNDCYECTDVADIAQCKGVRFCSVQENCFARTITDNGQQKYTFGCMAQDQCPGSGITPGIVGRGISTKTCEECCTGDLCNNQQCVKEPSDCFAIKHNGLGSSSGVYTVLLNSKQIQVFCDMDTDGGGWTVFQYRFNGSVDFYRTYSDYENGFGDLRGEFWLGLLYIREMTTLRQTELRVDLKADDGSTAYETFQNFSVSGHFYNLQVGQSAGTAGDSLSYNNRQIFSTHDQPDVYGCSGRYHGAWWYQDCTYSNLNGNYKVSGTGGDFYFTYKKYQSLKSTKMMFRRK